MKISRTGAFAGGIVMTLVLGGGTAVAANGGSFLLGRSNAATATTALTNSKGTPLALNAKAGSAPLSVNSSTRVTNLNADRLDGLSGGSYLRSTGKAVDADKVDGIDGAALALKGGRTGVIWGSATDVDKLTSTARCPAGTYATGGGGFVQEEGDALLYSGPDYNESDDSLIPNSWFAAANGPSLGFVTCYNPRGAVPGAATKAPWAQLPGAARSPAALKRAPSLGR